VALLADWLVHFKYTEEEEAAKMQHCEEVNQSINHVCRDSTVLDPQEVEVVLMEAKLLAPPPSSTKCCCDRLDFVEELTGGGHLFLHSNNLTECIEVCLLEVSPRRLLWCSAS